MNPGEPFTTENVHTISKYFLVFKDHEMDSAYSMHWDNEKCTELLVAKI
jgi:hypothetical protein